VSAGDVREAPQCSLGTLGQIPSAPTEHPLVTSSHSSPLCIEYLLPKRGDALPFFTFAAHFAFLSLEDLNLFENRPDFVQLWFSFWGAKAVPAVSEGKNGAVALQTAPAHDIDEAIAEELPCCTASDSRTHGVFGLSVCEGEVGAVFAFEFGVELKEHPHCFWAEAIEGGRSGTFDDRERRPRFMAPLPFLTGPTVMVFRHSNPLLDWPARATPGKGGAQSSPAGLFSSC